MYYALNICKERGIYAYDFEKPSAIQQKGIVPFIFQHPLNPLLSLHFLYPSPLPFTLPPPPQSMPMSAVSLTLRCVFSDLRLIGPNYVLGEKNDQYVKSVLRTIIWMGKKQEIVEDVPYGNTIAVVDSDQFITKDATLIS
ncbi:hypothetical protein PVL29_015864 [Vitis rotundifolia]|uniref:Uncharacterized protein n=1 Tax=Vitis rotundifolia TaxID=103349 RepID=A0AA38ZDT1_VITRO|nr:hypothetical protein PVL29_015864 [Vitis rotundifolia]